MLTPSGGDDTPIIRAELVSKGYAELDVGEFKVTSLDMTNKQGWMLKGQGIRTKLIPTSSGVNVIDLTGSSNMTLRDFRINGVGQPVVPSIGILCAQMDGNYNSDSIFIEGVRVDGSFSIATFYNLGVASSYVARSQFYNDRAMVILFTAANYFGASSQFVTISTTQYVPSDWTFVGSEVHQLSPAFGFFIGGSTGIRWYGGNIASSLYPVSLSGVAQSQPVDPNFIIFDGTTFYNDQPPVPACAVQGQAGLPPVHFRGNETGGIPLTGC